MKNLKIGIARYYNPHHGVFLSVDPGSGDEDDPVTMTNQDKEVVATYEYDAWGNVLKSEAKGIARQPIRICGIHV